MSHIAEMATTIESPDRALLRQAVQIVAGQYEGGEIRTHYQDYYDGVHRVSLAIATTEVYRGIGIVVKEKKLTFIGDGYGYEERYEQIQQQIVQSYIGLATKLALQTLGYQTTVEDGEQGRIVLTGVNYA